MKNSVIIFTALAVAGFLPQGVFAGNITNNFAWGSQVGWVNFGIPEGDVTVTDSEIIGSAWGSSYGWINLQPTLAGVSNDCGDLSGHAWGSALGWIDFDNVTIDDRGVFGGYASTEHNDTIIFTGQNIGVETSWRPDCDDKPVTPPVITTPPTTTTDPMPPITGTSEPEADIVVRDKDGNTICTTKADSDGKWTCKANTLTVGIHDLTATATLNGNALGSNTVRITITSEKVCLGEIGNSIFHDLNADGKEQKGVEAGIPDVDIKLEWAGSDSIWDTADDEKYKGTTGNKNGTYQGRYEFKNLPEGRYRVEINEDNIEEYIQTADPTGAVINNRASITLTCDEKRNDLDFGFTREDGEYLAQTGPE